MVSLHVVTGKGGVGKTTVAAALAGHLADGGARILLAEVEGRQLPAVPGVRRLHVDARESLTGYLSAHLRFGLAGRALERAGLVELATSIAPGLRDVLMIGALHSERDRVDAIVLDAPPTGRIGTFLGATEALGEAARLGPIHDQAARIARWLRSEACRVHLVTLPAEVPVAETLEAAADLRCRGLRTGHLVINRVPTVVPVGDADLLPAAARDYVLDARRRRAEAERHQAALAAVGLPTLVVGEGGVAGTDWGVLA